MTISNKTSMNLHNGQKEENFIFMSKSQNLVAYEVYVSSEKLKNLLFKLHILKITIPRPIKTLRARVITTIYMISHSRHKYIFIIVKPIFILFSKIAIIK